MTAHDSGAGVQDMISTCWHRDPRRRPAARALVTTLTDMKDEIALMDLRNARGVVPFTAGEQPAAPPPPGLLARFLACGGRRRARDGCF